MDGRDAHTVRAEADPLEGGTVTLKRGETAGMVLEVPEGERVTAEATPSEGYIFDGWYLSNGGSDTTLSLSRPRPWRAHIWCTVRATA